MQLLMLLLLILRLSLSHSSSSIDSDIRALLTFKDSADPSNSSLTSWSSSTSPCTSSWLGVTCSSSTPSSSPSPSPSSSLQLRVTRLVLEGLSLYGPIPPSLTSLSHLRVLSLKSNSLTGPIPPSLSSLSSLRLLFLSHNNLSGPLPDSISSLSHLSRLDLSFNSLTGPLSPLFNLTRLLTLRLDSNRFAGAISGLEALPSLQDLNISSNSLFGAIPSSLSRFSSASFLPNSNLCGPPLSASCRNAVSDPSRPKPSSAVDTPVSSSPGAKPEARGQSRMAKTAVIAIVIGDFVILLVVSGFLFCYFWRKFAGRRTRRNVAGESEKIVYSSSPYHAAPVLTMAGGFERGKMVYFEGTRRFELEELLRASAEMLGKGVYGTAYKAVLDGGDEVAVKRLREVGAAGDPAPRVREFEAQMEVIGRMRHHNLVALKAYYYARDEKLLVYDYMTGGSLFALLHGNRGPGRTPLDWTTRMRIATGTTRGLAYIHHYHHTTSSKSKLYHGNIKSTNILLDKSLTPKLADFALSPLFPSPPRCRHGYRAPEFLVDPRRPYSQKADIYALGVVLLEILTGKVVTDETSLPHWVQSVVREEWTSEVFDLELMRYRGVEEEMVGLLQVAMACVAAAPEQRPKIGQVLKMMEEIRGESGESPMYESYGETDSPCVSDETGTIVSQ